MADWAVRYRAARITLTYRAFTISEACYRYQPKLSAVNGSIADRLVAPTTAICVIDADGDIVWRGKVLTRIFPIASALEPHAPELVRAGMETGTVAVWLSHGLRGEGIPIDCIHARLAAAALKLQANKTDRNDARGLARLVRLGWHETVPMKSITTHRIRAIVVAREQIVRMCTALIKKIRGLAKTFGIIFGASKGARFD